MAAFNKPNLQGLQDYLNNNSQPQGDSIRWWSLPDGMCVIRILPPWDARGMIALPVYSHRITYNDPNSKYPKYTWTCVEKTFGKACNICRGLAQLRESGANTEQWDPTDRKFYANALVIHDPNYGRVQDALAPNTHVLLRLPKTVYDWIVSQITNPQIGDITDPQSGIDVMVTKTGKGLETKYACTLSPNGRTPIDPNVLSSLTLYDISDIFSTGFDDQRVEGLVNSLRSAATQMTAAMPQFQQQMNSNYPQIPQYQQYQAPMPPQYQAPAAPVYQPPQQPQTPPAPPVSSPAQGFQGYQTQPQTPSVPASPYGSQVPPMAPPSPVQTPPSPAPVAPMTAPQATGSHPTCYGKYDQSSVTCVVCPHEVECVRVSK